MNLITKITFKAGLTWDAKIEGILSIADIPFSYENQAQDMIVYFTQQTINLAKEYADSIETHDLQIAIELKFKDLHSSLNGKDIGGILIWELLQSYIPQRTAKTFREVWVFVVIDDTIRLRDLEHLLAVGFKHRVPVEIFESQESAIKAIIHKIHDYDDKIELSQPEYINSSEVNPVRKMLRTFDGMTNERMDELQDMFDYWQWNIMGVEFDSDIVPISFHELAKMIIRWKFEIEKRDAFWFKFMEHWMEGNNPLPIAKRELTDDLKRLKKHWRQ